MISYEKRTIFLTGAIIIAIGGIISFFFLPMTVQNMMLHTTNTFFIQTPSAVIKLYLAALACLTVAFLLVFFFWKKGIIPSILLTVGAIVMFVFAFNHFQLMSEEGITWSDLSSLEKQSYAWSEIKEIQSVPKTEGKGYNIVITFKDGNDVTFTRDAVFNSKYYKFQEKLTEYNLSFVGKD
ncbi:hypothetical protein [Litchfieldia salsa]|uniref:Uncharacterized protein n=1 Tax=Litchfieldia salsa TaxID=930152 RepID=A0A1H0T2N5_9BACI|nr:hypothetical protein [Litchfieldia salsa]SDP47816.1 hypothetical protein SAMN05216565_103236 [Litchfieldia salsa]